MTDLDVRLFRLLHEALSHGWLTPMAFLSVIGGGWGAFAVLPMLLVARTRRMATSLAGVLAVTTVLVFLVKRFVGRLRPCACLPELRGLVHDAPSDFSFPSGHSAGSFAFAIFLGIVLVRTKPDGADRRVRLLGAAALVLFAVGVGLSRIALGVHFPGDVLAGALLGATIATVGAHLHLAAPVTPRK